MHRYYTIQALAGGVFDELSADVLAPALQAAGVDGQLVDRDRSGTSGIREATACLVDISTNDPVAFFELGFALACRLPVVLICAADRMSPLPLSFDISHPRVIRYRADSSAALAALAREIADRLRGVLDWESCFPVLAADSNESAWSLDSKANATTVVRH